MKKIVLALGGNALGDSPQEQLEIVKNTSEQIVKLVDLGYQIVVVHGNGPQVGMINQAMSIAEENSNNIPNMPFAECGAMSQGYIGYHLQNAIKNELIDKGKEGKVATVVSQSLVDENDQAFDNPTKPIGSFYSQEEAEDLAKATGHIYKEDSGRGYRRVVPSPEPIDIIEKATIVDLLEAGNIVIAGGGGGIPVVEKNGVLIGIDAVIDKDLTASKMAEIIDADELVILTAVDQIAINFGQPDEEWLDEVSVDQAQKYLDGGEFGEGSMAPKVQAVIRFIESKDGGKALITSLEKVKEGLEGKTGTRIYK